MSKNAVLQATNMCKSFHQGNEVLVVLDNASLEILEGELVALVGQSGSGKSTFLHIAGLLDKPDSGHLVICDQLCSDVSDYTRTMVRRNSIGFIYQFHHLLEEFTAVENVMMPQLLLGVGRKEARAHAEEVLAFLDLADRLDHTSGQLSGGEQQRVAIARAIINKPALILADEPTGNLDPETAENVYQMLLKAAKGMGAAVLFVTHNEQLASRTDRVMTLKQGAIVKKG
tara:strand:+ start:125 stop:811 length:687 start_codon:yes stop_codon:yes gene_type:complete